MELTRLLQLQTGPVGEAIVRNDLSRAVATATDAAGIAGSGAAMPIGITNWAGVGSFNGGTIAWADVIEAQTDILSASASPDGQVSFVTSPAVAGVLAKRQGFRTTAPIWQGPLDQGTIAGCPAFTSTNVPAGTLIAGDFSQMLICDFGPGVEIRVNRFANFSTGIIGVAVFSTFDIVLRHAASFSIATSVS